MLELVGFILPPFIDLINRKIANDKLKYAVSMVVCLGISALFKMSEIKSGDILEVLQSGAIIFAEAQTVYKMYWKGSDERKALEVTFKRVF